MTVANSITCDQAFFFSFSFFFLTHSEDGSVAAREKTLAHSRSRNQNLQRGWRFIQNGGYGEKSEKYRDMAKVKIKKMEEKVQVKKEGKKTSFECKSFRKTAAPPSRARENRKFKNSQGLVARE